MSAVKKILLSLVCFTTGFLQTVYGHGYMTLPASRSSAWRFGFGTPANYDDNALYCGGFAHQWYVNDGKCGVCGDPFELDTKPNESIDGKYVTGVITGTYESGSHMTVNVLLTAYHKGWFEFRLCALSGPNEAVTQECLNRTLLAEVGTGITRFDLEQRLGGTGNYEFNLQLPTITCENCVLQWWYNAGNNCNQGCGLGPQETFRNCADIKLISMGTGNNDGGSSGSNNNGDNTADGTNTVDNNNNGPTTTGTNNDGANTVDDKTVDNNNNGPTTSGTNSDGANIVDDKTDGSNAGGDNTGVVNNDSGDCTCVGTGVFANNADMAAWCCANCASGYCPETHCNCS